MTETPRVDAACFSATCEKPESGNYELEVVHAEFARQLERDVAKLRHLLFMQHGSDEHYLYGDDGERHCNTCHIDFNADSVDEIDRKIYAYNMRKVADALAGGTLTIPAIDAARG